jgi:acyl-CoA synthetase (AMP-forming)/AMP-acid ligase II
VCLVTTNTIDFIISFFAISNMGAIAQPLNSAYKKAEFEWYLADTTPRMIIVDSTCIENMGIIEASDALNIPLYSYSCGGVTNDASLSVHLNSKCQMEKTEGAVKVAGEEDIALYLHTSGTTSAPKGVPLSHRNLIASIVNISGTYDLTEIDRTLIIMPLYHVHGLVAALLSTLGSGGTVILPEAGKFSASTFFRDANLHHPTWFTAVPTMHQIIYSTIEGHTDKSTHALGLRFVRSCSAPLHPSLLTKLEEVHLCPVLEAYAMTEAAHQMTSNPLPIRGEHKGGSVGRPQGGLQLRVFDDKGVSLPPGGVGSVYIKGRNVFSGYKNLSSDASFNKEGWFDTGDLGELDEDGYLYIRGRIKELINRGGEKLYVFNTQN